MNRWQRLNRQIIDCSKCARLRGYCSGIAAQKRRAFVTWEYWGRPVPNFGDAAARVLIVGLAPAAHGGNRTGRVFTGDRSGDWLFRALHRAGFANQPTSLSRDDGLKLTDCAITAAIHCAPPGNKPLPGEIANCHEYFERTIDLLPAQVFVALGQIAYKAILGEARRRGWLPDRVPKFSHGALANLTGSRYVIASYHPSQQNTFTGKLTEPMFDQIFAHARRLLDECSAS